MVLRKRYNLIYAEEKVEAGKEEKKKKAEVEEKGDLLQGLKGNRKLK